MHAPRTVHLAAVHRILRYLKGSPGQGILSRSHGHAKAMAYTDATWAGSLTDRKSTTVYCTMVGGNLISWKSKKQVVNAKSSAKAEYRVVAHGCCELLWLRILLEELGFNQGGQMYLYSDSVSAIKLANVFYIGIIIRAHL